MTLIVISERANALAFPLPFALTVQPNPDRGPLVACGCLGFLGVVIVAIIALHIALLIWVARDAKSRGMDNAVVWMILVMLTGIIGFIIYLVTRPQGNLIACAHCGSKRLQVSAKCSHCGNS